MSVQSANFRKKKCIVPSCLRTTDDGVRLHRCGDNFAKIGKILGRSTITKNSYICSLHFEESCFTRKGGLCPEAVPTRFLDGPGDAQGDVRRCSVPRCSRTENEALLFKGRQAFRSIGIEAGADLTKGWICDEHFEEECIDDRGRLKPGSMPTRVAEVRQDDGDGTVVKHISVRTIHGSNLKLILTDDIVEDIVDDLEEVDTRTENSNLKLQLRRAHEEIESLKRTISLLHSDINTKRSRIQTLEEELAQATSSWRQFEVRIVNE
ncbi:uncharacterized protein LOC111269575 isoform X2 [Varroa jacobsoni]|uniref:THAP-type domain-containing protein n=1 Tax=Varroa destructor TaxID=109461 RepID=A0A7M7M4P9_VARDE|nr:uncharacterized protein LOC111245146 isoform X2 [Varroa destructor]XP_022705043.1 uncharacterized protein LOC111269575 isoform X2 [Varroa jacobsoni]